MKKDDRPEHRPSDTDEEATFSSPPCFMHELRPEYLGYMSEDEVADVLADVKSLRAEAARADGAEGEVARRSLERKLRDCLPHIFPSTVRDELEDLLRRVEGT